MGARFGGGQLHTPTLPVSLSVSEHVLSNCWVAGAVGKRKENFRLSTWRRGGVRQMGN